MMENAGMKTVRFAIAGCGVISKTHADCIARLPGAVLAACCDSNAQKLRSFCNAYGCRGYVNLDDLMDQEDVDVVAVLTPSGLHAQIGLSALSRGKHILMEKPLEITMEKAQMLVQSARKAGRILCCISQHRFDHGIAALKSAIQAGELGRLSFGACHTKWFRSQEYYDSADWRGTWQWDGGGALMNQSIHYVDLLRYLMGEAEEVFAYCATRAHDIEVEDVAAAVVRFRSGAVGMIEGNTAAWPGYYTRLDIYGNDGSVVIQDDKVISWHMKSQKAYVPPQGGGGPITASSSAALSLDAHYRQYEDLIGAVREEREPLVNGEDALASLALVLAVYESARTGKPVRL